MLNSYPVSRSRGLQTTYSLPYLLKFVYDMQPTTSKTDFTLNVLSGCRGSGKGPWREVEPETHSPYPDPRPNPITVPTPFNSYLLHRLPTRHLDY